MHSLKPETAISVRPETRVCYHCTVCKRSLLSLRNLKLESAITVRSDTRNIYAYTHMHTYIYVYMRRDIYAHTHVRVCAYRHTHIDTYTHTYVYMHVCMYICICLFSQRLRKHFSTPLFGRYAGKDSLCHLWILMTSVL